MAGTLPSDDGGMHKSFLGVRECVRVCECGCVGWCVYVCAITIANWPPELASSKLFPMQTADLAFLDSKKEEKNGNKRKERI
jgi:hypothetical protein